MSNVWRAIGAPWVVGTGRGGVPEARRQVLHTASLSQKGGERTSLFGRFTFSFSLLGLHAATVHALVERLILFDRNARLPNRLQDNS